jgi:hypothetical protein
MLKPGSIIAWNGRADVDLNYKDVGLVVGVIITPTMEFLFHIMWNNGTFMDITSDRMHDLFGLSVSDYPLNVLQPPRARR